jgi:hypothetical protein
MLDGSSDKVLHALALIVSSVSSSAHAVFFVVNPAAVVLLTTSVAATWASSAAGFADAPCCLLPPWPCSCQQTLRFAATWALVYPFCLTAVPTCYLRVDALAACAAAAFC